MHLAFSRRTVIDIHLIDSSRHGLIVVAESKLAEGRQTSCPHPDLELLILAQIWNRVRFSVAIRISPGPIRRWCHIEIRVFRLLVEISIGAPCNASVRHTIRLSWFVARCVDQPRGVESIVEDGICDQPTRIVCLALMVRLDGIARAVVDGMVPDEVALQLVCVK